MEDNIEIDLNKKAKSFKVNDNLDKTIEEVFPRSNMLDYFKVFSDSMAEFGTAIKNSTKQIADANRNISKVFEEHRDIFKGIGDFFNSIPRGEDALNIMSNNSRLGWTLNGDMPILFYLDHNLIGMSNREIDEVFTLYYTDESNYQEMKKSILENIDLRWKTIMADVFNLYEENRYRVCIPLLVSIFEGEVANLMDTKSYGKNLKKELKRASDKVEEGFILNIEISSLRVYYEEHLFNDKRFSEERGYQINRHWVQHGRDNPELWTKTDALRLLNAISTIQFLKEHIRNDLQEEVNQ